jgi:hypothetical protein
MRRFAYCDLSSRDQALGSRPQALLKFIACQRVVTARIICGAHARISRTKSIAGTLIRQIFLSCGPDREFRFK